LDETRPIKFVEMNSQCGDKWLYHRGHGVYIGIYSKTVYKLRATDWNILVYDIELNTCDKPNKVCSNEILEVTN